MNRENFRVEISVLLFLHIKNALLKISKKKNKQRISDIFLYL